MNLKRLLSNSFYPIVESLEKKFDAVVYDCNIIADDRHEIFRKMYVLGINTPPNAVYLSYITLPITSDNMLMSKSFFPSKKSITPINDVKIFLENQFGDTVYFSSSLKYTNSGNEIPNNVQKVTISYCTLVNFSY